MAVSLCTTQDVSDLWSDDGVLGRLDDDNDNANNAAELAILARVILNASAFVLSRVGMRYKTSDITGSNAPTDTPQIVRFYTSVIASHYLAIRRGNPTTDGFAELYSQVMRDLEQVQNGSMLLPGVVDSLNQLPFVSNFHIDGNYRSAKARKIYSISTGIFSAPAGSALKIHPENNIVPTFE